MGVVTKTKLKKQRIREGLCGTCAKPRVPHETFGGTWLPSDTTCGKCRYEAVRSEG